MSPQHDPRLRSFVRAISPWLNRLHHGAGLDPRIVAFSLVFGGIAWIVDAILDSAFFYDASVVARLWADVSTHDFYMRTTMVASLLAFGVIASWMSAGLRERERDRTLFRTLLDEANDAVFVIDGSTGTRTLSNSIGTARWSTSGDQTPRRPSRSRPP